jgi:hypothetical protein
VALKIGQSGRRMVCHGAAQSNRDRAVT